MAGRRLLQTRVNQNIALAVLTAAILTDLFGGPPAGECPKTGQGPQDPGVPPQGGPGQGLPQQPPVNPNGGNNGVPPRPGYQPYQGPGYNQNTGASNGVPPNNAMPGSPNYNPGLEAQTNNLNNTQNNDVGQNGAYPNGYQPGGGYNGGSSTGQ